MPTSAAKTEASPRRGHPTGQVVLVLQGGGALGACQAGVYQGLCEGGVTPDWVIGTSIGAINGALIGGNTPQDRLSKLQEFWGRVGNRRGFDDAWSSSFFGAMMANLTTIFQGIPGFFQANPHASWGINVPVGVKRAAFYSTEPLRRTLAELVDFDDPALHTEADAGEVTNGPGAVLRRGERSGISASAEFRFGSIASVLRCPPYVRFAGKVGNTVCC